MGNYQNDKCTQAFCINNAMRIAFFFFKWNEMCAKGEKVDEWRYE